MSDEVLFEDEDPLLNPIKLTTAQIKKRRKGGSITGMIISWGLAKDESQANIFLLIAAVIIFVIAAAVFFLGQPHNSAHAAVGSSPAVHSE